MRKKALYEYIERSIAEILKQILIFIPLVFILNYPHDKII